MSRIEVFEPALCCSTGVCGEDVDQSLITFTADMDWVRSRGGDIARFNLAGEPLAFAESEPVKAFLELAGSDGLPLVLVDGVTVATGHYPNRDQLAKWAGITTNDVAAGDVRPLRITSAAGSCCSSESDNLGC